MNPNYVFATENLSDIWLELPPLVRAHSLEVRGHENGRPDVQWYSDMNHAGLIRMYTVRKTDDGSMVGYCSMIISTDNQHKGVGTATQDSLFVYREHRKGGLGSDFIKYIERMLVGEKVATIYQSITPANDFSKLLTRQGYRMCTSVYAKQIGDSTHGNT